MGVWSREVRPGVGRPPSSTRTQWPGLLQDATPFPLDTPF